eukprot:gene5214-4236_t
MATDGIDEAFGRIEAFERIDQRDRMLHPRHAALGDANMSGGRVGHVDGCHAGQLGGAPGWEEA